ncbi:MAG: hypothetical protein N4A57_10555 [Anaeromicrobium sp.]|uniref:MazG nucleotide pyrophosphohydrolase domain-containing protein n=1 Tax=Anaeromicrobium sp. TaxID=1929132 RepID=UPI0025CE3498|nr:MazG nucleotide pyrophosphohydrolase domain-containing protein [Anaeromicrobium sp.]MCT4594691.1 hypothetical protein [Anaeromicrobium sp.]
MEIKEAIDLIWKNRKYTTDDPKKAISHLNEEVAESMKALIKGDINKAKRELEDALSCLFIALKVMDVDVEKAITNQIRQMNSRNKKVMIFRKDKVEILVDNNVKGGWYVWSEEDLKEAEKIAKEFGCEIIYENKSF